MSWDTAFTAFAAFEPVDWRNCRRGCLPKITDSAFTWALSGQASLHSGNQGLSPATRRRTFSFVGTTALVRVTGNTTTDTTETGDMTARLGAAADDVEGSAVTDHLRPIPLRRDGDQTAPGMRHSQFALVYAS